MLMLVLVVALVLMASVGGFVLCRRWWKSIHNRLKQLALLVPFRKFKVEYDLQIIPGGIIICSPVLIIDPEASNGEVKAIKEYQEAQADSELALCAMIAIPMLTPLAICAIVLCMTQTA